MDASSKEQSDTPVFPSRNRLTIFVGLISVVIIIIASRAFPSLFPLFLGNYPGDALWALVVLLCWAFIFPQWPTARLALIALFNSYFVEFLQLYQAEWIIAVRSTKIGHLVLGSTFSWIDLVAYSIGIAMGVGFDGLVSGIWRGGIRAAPDLHS